LKSWSQKEARWKILKACGAITLVNHVTTNIGMMMGTLANLLMQRRRERTVFASTTGEGRQGATPVVRKRARFNIAIACIVVVAVAAHATALNADEATVAAQRENVETGSDAPIHRTTMPMNDSTRFM
jgi:hypothetical protein